MIVVLGHYTGIIKGSVPVTGPVVAQRVDRGIALLFHEHGTRRGEWLAARPGRTLPLAKAWYPVYRRLGGLQGRSGRAESLAQLGFDPRTVQPVAQSLYRLSYPAHYTGTIGVRKLRYTDKCSFTSSNSHDWCARTKKPTHIQGDTKKREFLKNPTKIEEIQEKKFIDRN